jgi:hypothetical protein
VPRLARPDERASADDLEGFIRDVALPAIALAERVVVHPPLAEPALVARTEVQRVLSIERRTPGPVAVAIGSRGISNLVAITESVVGALRDEGWSPFVVPAMGSHGGGSPEGRVAVLAELGISEERLGVRIRASNDVVDLGIVDGVHAYLDRFAAEAGAVFLINRVKLHTDFRGPIESGPAKMLALGLGHVAGASELHAAGPEGLRLGIPAVATHTVSKGLVLGALAIIENEVGETAVVRGVRPIDIGGSLETRLLVDAAAMMPSIPFDRLDVLVVDQMGKDISGEGVDPNVIGRMHITGVEEPRSPNISCIVVLNLTDASSGNALGVGLVDFIPEKLRRRIDTRALYANALTSGIVDIRRAKIPVVLSTDRLAIQAALASCGRRDLDDVRLLWIRNTKAIDVFGVSPALASEAGSRTDLRLLPGTHQMRFGADGSLEPIDEIYAKGRP